MLEPTERLARLSQLKHQQLLREAAEQRRAAQAGGWGLRWHTAQLLLSVAVWVSPAHRTHPNTQQTLPEQVS